MSKPDSLANQSVITLQVNHERLSGWQGLTVTRAIDAAADAYAFSLPWDPTDANMARFRPFFVRNVKVFVDDTLLIEGYLEKLDFSTSSANRQLQVQGRSASAVAVDWAAGPPFQLESLTFNAVAKKLTQAIYSGFTGGIAYASPDFGPIPEVVIEPGDTVFKVLSALASAQGLWPIPDDGGKFIKFAKISSSQAPVAYLEEGLSPVRVVGTSHDVTKRFQRYLAIGAAEGEPEVSAEVSDYEDLGIGVRGRKIEALTQQTGDITQAAKYLRARAVIDSYAATVEVDGWHYNGHLWTPGEIVVVKAPGAYIPEETRLVIMQADMTIDESGGQATTLNLGLPEAFDGTEPRRLPWA